MKNLSLALAGLLLAVLAAPAVAADDVSVAPPNPCYYTQCPPPPCLACPIDPPTCDLSDRSCHPEPMPWACAANDPGLGGVVGDTVRYGFSLAAIACAVALSEANIALEATGDSTYYAYTQGMDTADFVLRTRFPGLSIAIAPIVGPLSDTAGYEVALVCGFLLGPSACLGPAPVPGTCPVDLPSAGGVVGDTLAVAEAGCAAAEGGASASAAAAADEARDALLAVSALLRAYGDHAGAALAGAEAHAGTMAGHATDAANVVVWGAGSAYGATCAFAFGSCPV